MTPEDSYLRAETFDAAADEKAERRAAERTSRLLTERELGGFRGDIFELARIVATEGSDKLLPLLTSRADRRSAISAMEPLLMPSWMWRAGIGIGMADLLLERLDTPWLTYLPGDNSQIWWAAELREGLDSFARVAWCLRFGHTTAAVAIARKAFERWSFNIASSNELEVVENETETEFFTRAWNLSSNYVGERELGAEWGSLSELLHGRAANVAGRHVTLALEMQLADQTRVHRMIALFAEVWLRQVRGAVCRLAHESGRLDLNEAQAALLRVEDVKGLPTQPDFLTVFWEPLLYGFVDSKDAATYVGWGATYRRIVAAQADQPLSILMFSDWMSMEERWARAIERSQHAFESERQFIREEFSPLSVRVRVSRYRLVSEMSDLLADEIEDGYRGDAIRSAAAALESAWVLWLQDVDDSLTLARAVLENTARARVHRIKPLKGSKMEGGPQTNKAPHRWIEAAGWGRLSPFMRALSEYSHMKANSRHLASWKLLIKVQDLEPNASAEHTARGHALERVGVMLAHEVVASMESKWPSLANEFRQLVLEEDEETSQRSFERWLDVTLGLKATHSFDHPDSN